MDGGSGRAYALGTISGLAAAYLFYTACKWSAARSGPAYRSGAANSSGAAAAGTGPLASDLEDEILSEQFTRNIQFFGREGQQKISEAYVVVVGLGGVGSHAAHLLLRSGVGRLKLVDFDQVSLSSLNRHAVATRADVGLPKATVLARHLKDIVPEARVEPCVMMYTRQNEDAILGGDRKPDFVIDCIDDMDTKVDLLAACCARDIPRLCIGGAAAKADPTRLRFVDIKEAMIDHLAVKIRWRLRREHGITAGVPVLLSTEKRRVDHVFTAELAAADNMLDYQTIPGFRMCAIPVVGTMPAVFGMAAASWVLCSLAGKSYVPEPIFQITRPQYLVLMEYLHEDEDARFGHCDQVGVDAEEVGYLVSNLWRGVSAHRLGVGDTAVDKGLHRRTAGLRLVRFDDKRPALPQNLVLMTEEEVEELRSMGLERWRAAHPVTAAWVQEVFGRAEHVYGKI